MELQLCDEMCNWTGIGKRWLTLARQGQAVLRHAPPIEGEIVVVNKAVATIEALRALVARIHGDIQQRYAALLTRADQRCQQLRAGSLAARVGFDHDREQFG